MAKVEIELKDLKILLSGYNQMRDLASGSCTFPQMYNLTTMNSDEWLKMIEKIPQCSSVKFSVSWKTYKKLQKIAHRFHGIKIHARKFAHPTPYQMKRIRLNRKVVL